MTQYTKEVDEQRQRLKFEEKDDTLVYYYWQADGDLRKYKYQMAYLHYPSKLF